MDGIHDLGGRHGFGPVSATERDEAFHERWEAVVFSFLAAGWRSGAIRNVDQFRHAIEYVDPGAYLTHGYYGRWLGALEMLFLESGVLTGEDIEARLGNASRDESLVAARPRADAAAIDYGPGGRTARRPLGTAPRFAIGDRVRTLSHGVPGHTRLPHYARGRTGVVIGHHDGWVFPDSNAHGLGECPVHLYTIRFDGQTLWGESGEAGVKVNLDLFEPYLEPVEEER